MTKEILEESCLEERLPQKDSRIGIKPNLVSPSDPSWGATTHTEVVAGIIEYLQERGYKNLVILEGSWVGDKTWDTVSVCGYDKLFETYQVEFCTRYSGNTAIPSPRVTCTSSTTSGENARSPRNKTTIKRSS